VLIGVTDGRVVVGWCCGELVGGGTVGAALRAELVVVFIDRLATGFASFVHARAATPAGVSTNDRTGVSTNDGTGVSGSIVRAI
jgi:hypothetical protein